MPNKKTLLLGFVVLVGLCALAFGAIVNGYLDFTVLGSPPSSPGSGYQRVYVTGASGLSCKDSAGASCLASGGGSSGPSGPSGVAGPSGPSGRSGPSGVTGSIGPSGPSGPTGVTGSSGVSGPSGVTGATGSTGPSGPSGPTGSTGASGVSGPSGNSGPSGASGPSGNSGPSGPVSTPASTNWGSYGTSAINLVTLNGVFGPLFGTGTPGVTESLVQSTVAVATSLGNLRVNSGNIGAGDALSVTLRVNGVSSALTCTVAASGTACSDTTHSVSVVAGDLVSVVFASSGLSLPTSSQLSYGVSQTGALGPSGPSGPGGGGGGFTQISQTVLGSPAASVAFSSISGSYSSLMVVLQARSAVVATTDDIRCKINTDATSGNYLGQIMDAFGNTTAKAFPAAGSALGFYVATIAGASAPAGSASATSILLPGYAGTTFLKNAHITTTSLLGTTFVVANLDTTVIGVMWNSTSAINALTLSLSSGSNFATGSTFTLYALQ